MVKGGSSCNSCIDKPNALDLNLGELPDGIQAIKYFRLFYTQHFLSIFNFDFDFAKSI